jgi:predicted MFS family arabinose efflux permease
MLRPRALALAGFTAMAAANGIGRFIYTPILPSMIEQLGLTPGDAGLIAGANFAGYLAGALAAASPRLPGKTRDWMLWSLVISAVTTTGMGLVFRMPEFLLLRFIGGAASACVVVLASTLILQRLSAAHRSDLAAWHFAGVGAGIALSALLTELMQAIHLDWRWMWLGGGSVSLVAVLTVGALLPTDTATQSVSGSLRSVGRSALLMQLIVAYGLFGFGYIITATFIVAIVRGSSDIRQYEYAIWLVVGLCAIPSVSFWSGLAHRYGVLRVFALACITEAIGIVTSVVWLDIFGLLLAAVLLGGTFMGITALGLMAARALATDSERRALAKVTAAFGLGQAIGPVVAGYGFDITGSFFLPSMLAAAGLMVATILALNIDRLPRPDGMDA